MVEKGDDLMKRSSGVLMHITSLWGEYSCGSFGTPAKEWIDFLAESKFTYWQILPFCIPDEYNSPYKSFSAFSGNPFFIDLPTLEEQGLITKEELNAAQQKSPYLCEFDRLNKERLALLKVAASRFTDVDAMNAFFKTHKHTEAFCKFMALREANGGKPWAEWTKKKVNNEALFAWKFIQYTVFTQWKSIKDYANAKGVKIIGDIPIYVDIDSSDVWASPGGATAWPLCASCSTVCASTTSAGLNPTSPFPPKNLPQEMVSGSRAPAWSLCVPSRRFAVIS
jgi:4-alpha-glucanotransferase